jgi:Mg2+-importing ATPase
VEEIRDRCGTNEIVQSSQHGFFHEIFERFKNPLIIQLLVIAISSGLLGDWNSTIVVCFMIFLSIALGYYHETKSSKAVKKLRDLVQTESVVIRDNKEMDIPMADIVPGDIVVLHAGSIIPADLRLISTKDFFVSQSALTGESLPVEKNSDPSDMSGKNLIELKNACFQGSNVLTGSAKGVVINTGQKTYLGSISKKLGTQRSQTSFEKGINQFTWLMIKFMVVMVFFVFMIQGFTKGNWAEAFMFGLAVAVGLTPEMLPMIMTVNLSKGALAMSRKKVIVKRLNSIQNFGAIDVLCTDKTGTLTQDKIILERHVDVTNRPSEDVLRYAYMNSYYQTGLRNLLDRAILSNVDLDVEKNCKKVDEIPFDFSRKRMSVVIDYEDSHVLICKGAVEEVYQTCTHYQVDEDIYPLIGLIKSDLMEEYEELSRNGYRVLAVAYREFPKTQTTFSTHDEANLILLGYLAFLDPPKDSAAQAIESLKHRGVAVKVLTGDNELVTQKICHDVGLDYEHVVTGEQLIGLDEAHLGDLVERASVFARLSPLQKEEIILALQKRNHVVGFLGDGINDAPAMKAADVGISVDTAVDIAKESADIILLQKSLLVLEDGLLEGRRVFSNILKYIRMGASSNFGNMFSMVGSSFFLPFLPMSAIQVLVNNLLYDFSQVGIPADNVDAEFMEKPRRWNIENIKKFMIFIGPISSIFDYATFFVMLYVFNCIAFSSSQSTSKDYLERLFHTGWFIESLMTQTLIVHLIRTHKIPFIQSHASIWLTLSTTIAMGIGCAMPYIPPVAHFLKLEPLPLHYWYWLISIILSYAILTHFVKSWFYRRFGIE